jgi:hypothetical protein
MKKIKGVNIGNIEVVLQGNKDDSKDYDFGALTLACDDREFMLDVCQSYTDTPEKTGNNTTRITLDVETDTELFNKCPYNLTKQDLLDCEHNDLTRELYVGGNFENKVLSITFYFEVDGQDYSMLIEQE